MQSQKSVPLVVLQRIFRIRVSQAATDRGRRQGIPIRLVFQQSGAMNEFVFLPVRTRLDAVSLRCKR